MFLWMLTAWAATATTTLTYCSDLELDLSLPARSRTKAPVVILVHGGGWSHGSRTDAGITLPRTELIQRGYAVASIDYSLANGSTVLWTDQVADVQCAIAFVRSAAPTYWLDRNRMALLGASAGGHLAAMASEEVAALVLWYAPTDLTLDFPGLSMPVKHTIFGTFRPGDAERVAASPIYAVTPPTTLLVHGTVDGLIPYTQSETAAAVWGATLIPVDGATHGFVGGDTAAVVTATADWLDTVLP